MSEREWSKWTRDASGRFTRWRPSSGEFDPYSRAESQDTQQTLKSDYLNALETEIAALKKFEALAQPLLTRLSVLYNANPARVAAIFDEQLDTTGTALGWLRDVASYDALKGES